MVTSKSIQPNIQITATFPFEFQLVRNTGFDCFYTRTSVERIKNISSRRVCAMRQWNDISFLAFIYTLSDFIKSVAGQCSRIQVQNAEYQVAVNGDYLLVEDDECDNLQLWFQANVDHPSYLFYSSYTGDTLNKSDQGWIIGPDKCLLTIVYVEAKESNSDQYPYNIPLGSWFELSDNQYVNSNSLTVKCMDNDWYVWVVTWLLVAGLCAGAIAAVVLIGSYIRKRRRTRRRSTTSNVSSWTAATRSSVSTVATIDSVAMYPSLPPYSVRPRPLNEDGSGNDLYNMMTSLPNTLEPWMLSLQPPRYSVCLNDRSHPFDNITPPPSYQP